MTLRCTHALLLCAPLLLATACGEKEPDDTGPSVVDADNDGYDADVDCDDSDPAVHPGAEEVCDGVDDDCDGEIDDGAGDAWYPDADADGYGDAAGEVLACAQPTGFVEDDTDCDDTDADVYPGAPERCNGVDDDCDGDVDDNPTTTWYADTDGDAYGNAAYAINSCDPGAGWVADDTDCDDTDEAVFPGAPERCNDVDDDCDGDIDEELATTWYADTDGDGYGDVATTSSECDPGSGWVADDTDCDDADAAISPGADEYCDGVDNDCDGAVDDDDDDVADPATWYLDGDGDGYGLDTDTTAACVLPSGYAELGGDCDDGDTAYNPGAAETDCADPNDYNCDGSVGYADDDGDGYAACEECDDTDAAIFPGADEVCDGADNDCDGAVDEDAAVDAPTWYGDADGDGYGEAASTAVACAAPSGFVADATDCDDADGAINPGAAELCDTLDNDCDGDVDDDDAGVTDQSTWYGDADGDGYGDAASAMDACFQPSDYVADATDCDDVSDAVNPGATETCDTVDNDCDGTVDEADAVDAATWYGDADADGYGDAARSTLACDQPTGFVSDDTDCDDHDDDVNPGASELCNGTDDDCDGTVDEDDALDADTWYADADGDGYGDAATTAVACTVPSGYLADATDCDDSDPAIKPGATEVCDGADNDCDGLTDDDDPGVTGLSTWYADSDSDGYGYVAYHLDACAAPSGYVADATDCDDLSAASYPGADEVCDGDDNDCDGTVDELGAVDGDTVFADTDGDTYGDPSTSTTACASTSGWVADDTDCDDADATSYPGAPELCDGVDNDCDGTSDDELSDWYPDADSDGYGDAASGISSCTAPSGYIADSSDCDDTDPAISPAAAEVAGDSADNDCDGLTDEDGVLSVDGITYSLTDGEYAYDAVEVINGGTLYVDGEVVIEALDFIVDSTSAVDGDAGGDAGGSGTADGSGDGGGGSSDNTGGGGGGYGGAGGQPGYDSGDTRAAAGATYGDSSSMSVLVGSGGGGGVDSTGGSGGASLSVFADVITVDGVVSVSGGAGDMSLSSGLQGGGGGSGGGLLLVGDDLLISGLLDASGGDGGDGTASSWAEFTDGGGGGGGGRIKLFYATSLSFTGSYYVSGGVGGCCGYADYGEDGEDGTTYESTY